MFLSNLSVIVITPLFLLLLPTGIMLGCTQINILLIIKSGALLRGHGKRALRSAYVTSQPPKTVEQKRRLLNFPILAAPHMNAFIHFQHDIGDDIEACPGQQRPHPIYEGLVDSLHFENTGHYIGDGNQYGNTPQHVVK